MSSSSSSVPGVVVAVAMAAVCGAAVIQLALKLQKSHSPPSETTPPLSPPRSCISSGERKEAKKRKKRVRFAKDVADPSGNGEEFRNRIKIGAGEGNSGVGAASASGGMPANRVVMYNSMLRDRGSHRLAYSC